MDYNKAIILIQKSFKGEIASIFSNYGSFIQIDYMDTEEMASKGIFVFLGKWTIFHSNNILLKSNFKSRKKA